MRSHMPLSYGVGALAALAISIGFAAIVYGGGIYPFDPFNLPAWVLGPLGIYTIIYSLTARKDTFYYLTWGSVMAAIAAASTLYTIVNTIVVFGLLIIAIAVIGLVAYTRRRT